MAVLAALVAVVVGMVSVGRHQLQVGYTLMEAIR